MAGSGKHPGKEALKNKAILVVRNVTQQEVTNVLIPNGLTVGTVDLRNGFKVHGNATVAGVMNAREVRVNGKKLLGGSPLLFLDPDSNVFAFDSEGDSTASPSSITLTALQISQSSTLPESAFHVSGADGTDLITYLGSHAISEFSAGNSVRTATLSYNHAAMSSDSIWPIETKVIHDGLSSTKKISKVTGATAVNVDLTSPVIPVSTDNNGGHPTTGGQLDNGNSDPADDIPSNAFTKVGVDAGSTSLTFSGHSDGGSSHDPIDGNYRIISNDITAITSNGTTVPDIKARDAYNAGSDITSNDTSYFVQFNTADKILVLKIDSDSGDAKLQVFLLDRYEMDGATEFDNITVQIPIRVNVGGNLVTHTRTLNVVKIKNGSNGSNGSIGPIGPIGPTGPTGPIGPIGSDGADSFTVSLRGSSSAFAYDENGANPSPSSITLTAQSQNYTDAYFLFSGGGSNFSDDSSYLDGSSANSATRTLNAPATYSSTPINIAVQVNEGGSIGTNERVDTISISSVKNGSAGATGQSAAIFTIAKESQTPGTNDAHGIKVAMKMANSPLSKAFSAQGFTFGNQTGIGQSATSNRGGTGTISASGNIFTAANSTPTWCAYDSINGTFTLDAGNYYNVEFGVGLLFEGTQPGNAFGSAPAKRTFSSSLLMLASYNGSAPSSSDVLWQSDAFDYYTPARSTLNAGNNTSQCEARAYMSIPMFESNYNAQLSVNVADPAILDGIRDDFLGLSNTSPKGSAPSTPLIYHASVDPILKFMISTSRNDTQTGSPSTDATSHLSLINSSEDGHTSSEFIYHERIYEIVGLSKSDLIVAGTTTTAQNSYGFLQYLTDPDWSTFLKITKVS